MRNQKRLLTGIALILCSFMLFGCAKKEEPFVENEVTMEGQTLALAGVANARQLGGYRTEDGRTVKKDVLLRTAKLADAAEEDIAALANRYHVTEVVDFRTAAEIAQAPNPEIPGAKNIEVPIISEDMYKTIASKSRAFYSEGMDRSQFALELHRAGVFSAIYENMFETEMSLQGYREFLDLLLEHGDGAILWHCTSGKDRTGVGAMVILTLLGVDKETILQDYTLTNEFYRDEIEELREEVSLLTDDPGEVDGALNQYGVSRSFLEDLYARAENESGSMLEYLKAKLNITDDEIRTLQEKYLKDENQEK